MDRATVLWAMFNMLEQTLRAEFMGMTRAEQHALAWKLKEVADQMRMILDLTKSQ